MNSNKRPYKSQELTKPKKGAIIGLHKGGNSVRKIADILRVPKSAVQDTVKILVPLTTKLEQDNQNSLMTDIYAVFTK